MRTTIVNALRAIEEKHGVTMLYACESGSRAWEFSSEDSDYDVRFVYAFPRDRHLQIHDDRDVIEKTNIEERSFLDMSGWELKKTLGLMYKGNPPLWEWLNSPTVYLETPEFAALRHVAWSYFSVPSSCYHYFHMAYGNHRQYLCGDMVLMKKYLYVIRPLLCVRYLVEFGSMPPMGIDALMQASHLPSDVREHIEALVRAKRNGAELGAQAPDGVFRDWIKSEISHWENRPKPPFGRNSASSPREPLNEVFRGVLSALEDTNGKN